MHATNKHHRKGTTMLSTILLIFLILILVGALPTSGHSRNWGYGPVTSRTIKMICTTKVRPHLAIRG